MSNRLDELTRVRIELRLTVPWTSPDEVNEAMARGDTGYHIDDAQEYLVRAADGWRCICGHSEHDDEIADIFAHTGRPSRRELDAIASHALKVHLHGAGGSVESARDMMNAATALVRVGATGVMVDNSAATHAALDWMELAEDTQPGGLYWAYVHLTGGPDEVYSTGMHCQGLADAEVGETPDSDFAGKFLHNFLGYTYQSGKTVREGDTFDAPDGTTCRITHHPDTRVPERSPFHNPYGVWHLEPIEE